MVGKRGSVVRPCPVRWFVVAECLIGGLLAVAVGRPSGSRPAVRWW